MKKVVLTAVTFLFSILGVTAQETETTLTEQKANHGLYMGGGAAFTTYKLNDKLAANDLPKINSGAFELTIGYNVTAEKMIVDLEWNTNYFKDKKTNDETVRTVSTGAKLRVHYIPFKFKKTFISGGLDVSYMYKSVNIFTKDNVIDLNNLNPATHTGDIRLNNSLLYIGPSVSFGVFQKSDTPLKFVTGYEWGLTNGKWKSDVARVENTVKESGSGRFYAKLVWGL